MMPGYSTRFDVDEPEILFSVSMQEVLALHMHSVSHSELKQRERRGQPECPVGTCQPPRVVV